MQHITDRQDTIAAVATGASYGALAVIRVSGPSAMPAVSAIARKKGAAPDFADRRAELVEIIDGKEKLDSCITTFFRAPASFTGEDIIEIACHGSPFITGRIMNLLAEHGVRPAGPGEFTMRACLNGKIDLAQAEGICDLIMSRTAASHRAAVALSEGRMSAKFKTIRDAVIGLLAEIEARLDDADSEIDGLDTDSFISKLDEALNSVNAFAATYKAGKMIREGVKVCIAGAPNSGKSSLLNALAGYDRAIVAPTPGTTRDTVDETLSIGGMAFTLTDTAGIRRHAVDPAEAEGMNRTRAAIKQSDIIILVQDCSSQDERADALETEISNSVMPGQKLIKILNKADLCPQQNPDAVSCKTGAGIEKLRERLQKAASPEGDNEMLVTSARHYNCLFAASKELSAAKETISPEPKLELCAVHLNSALIKLRELIGDTTPDDILESVFSKFCVGK